MVLVVNSAIYSTKILTYSPQVRSPQQGIFILLAYAREILGIIAEDLIYNYSDKILPNLCKGIARSKFFLILLAYAREILGDYCRGFWLV